ncbi:MAG TPA: hypothetical protein PKV71_02790 [Calditrichia bacterium]|nr:hypothetical protein [Calditrichia bacterium]
MSYQKRNLITLASVLLFLALIFGYFILISYPEENRKAQDRLGRVNQRIGSLSGIESDYHAFDALLQDQKKRLSQLDRILVNQISSASTYKYLNDILNRIGFLEFNLQFVKEHNNDTYGYHQYRLKGEGSYKRVFDFITMIERGPLLNKITRLNMRGVESGSNVVVPFEMELRAYFGKFDELPLPDRSLADVQMVQASDPFNPIIKRRLPRNSTGLLEVERASLMAIVPGKALIADYKGKIYELSKGSQVYLGYLTTINQAANEVVFTLNKGGAVTNYVMKLNFD